MKTKYLLWLVPFFLVVATAQAQSTAFNYQGRLNDNGASANGSYDLQFTVFDAATNGNVIGSVVTKAATGVSNGLFTVQLNFGAGVFDGSARWLELAVRTNGSNSAFTSLLPRQIMTSTPYAIQSANATVATTALNANSVSAANITGTIASAQLPADILTNNATGVTLNGNFVGDGAALTNMTVPITSVTVKFPQVTAWGASGNFIPVALNDITAIAQGNGHSLALTANGNVIAWDSSGARNIPDGLFGVSSIAAGGPSVALKYDGTVVVWDATYPGNPAPSFPLFGATAIAAGDSFWMAVVAGSIFTWGDGGSHNVTTLPPGLFGVTAIAAQGEHALAVIYDGTVVAWGDNTFGESTVPAGLTDVKAVAAGRHHSLALKNDGTVVAWGTNDAGQTNVPPDLNNVAAIAAGDHHSLALKKDGTIVAWGSDTVGQLQVPFINRVKAISAGGDNSLALFDVVQPANFALMDHTITGFFMGDGSGLMNIPYSSLTGTMDLNAVPDLPASKIASGVLNTARIPNIDGSKITSGTITSNHFDAATWQAVTKGDGGNATLASNVVSGIRITNAVISGDGAGLTNISLDASNMTNIARLDAAQTFSNTNTFATKVSIGTRSNIIDAQSFNLRVVGDTGSAWKGAGGFGNQNATVVVGELSGVPTIAGQNESLNAWKDLAINPSGKVAIGTTNFSATDVLTVNGSVGATAFTGDGSGLTNLNASKIAGVLSATQVPVLDASKITSGVLSTAQVPALDASKITSGVLSGSQVPGFDVLLGSTAMQTNIYSSDGSYDVIIPPGAASMVVRLWGAGGGGGFFALSAVMGGGGAFVQTTLSVNPGETYKVVVGQGGGIGSNSAGGVGSNNGEGGASGLNEAYAGQGGQASSLFKVSGGVYITKAVAGAGGGAGPVAAGGAGGNPGATGASYHTSVGGSGGSNGIGGAGGINGYGSGSTGGNYSTNATTTGEASLSLIGGKGGNGYNYSGGGGGGYGGGGGGGGGAPNSGDGGGGGGGGSYGPTIIAGNGNIPGNTADSYYISPRGQGANGVGNSGLVVITFFRSGSVSFPGTVQSAGFVGDGSNLTNLSASQLTGTIALARLPAAVVTNTQTGVTLSGTFTGNGSGLTNLSASQISSGTLPLAQLPSAVITNNQTGVTLSGNGVGWTNLNASQLTGGTVALARLPSSVITNTQTAVTLAGTFTGNGAGLTNLNVNVTNVNATNITGTLSDTLLSGNVAKLNATQTFSNINKFATNVTIGTRPGFSESQAMCLRVVGDPGSAWKGSGAFGNSNATVILGEISGIATLGAHNADLTAWGNLAINPSAGNVGIGTTDFSSGNKLIVGGTIGATAFNNTSDRNLKEHFAPVDVQAVLAKVVALPISTWNFKQETNTQHIGPMAQDFYAAFGTGSDDKHIATVDADGVALAAVQALNKKLEEKTSEVEELKQRLEKMETLLKKLSEQQDKPSKH